MKIERVALVHHGGRDRAEQAREEMQELMSERGIAVVDDDPQLVISLGGDGTMLRAARLAFQSDAYLLGINLGSLGYLTEADASGARGVTEQVLEGNFEIDERLVIQCDAQGVEGPLIGVNEALVERSSRHRLVQLSVRIGGEELASLNADGLIVATPTGSTAYALSAGGPIVAPTATCLVVVPVSAHVLSFRPLVLSADEVVEIRIGEKEEGAVLALDGGWGGPLDPGATVVVRRHPQPLKLVRAGSPGFLARLQGKLNFPH